MWVFLSILILSAGTVTAADFDDLIGQGRAAFLALDLDTAQELYGQACRAGQTAALTLPKIAFCEHELGTVAEARGDDDEAFSRYLKAQAAWEKLGPQYLADNIVTMINLGGLYRRQYRVAEAEKILSRALELAKTLTGSDAALFAMALSRTGSLYGDLDRPDRAQPMLEEAIAGLRAAIPPNAPELALAYSSLGLIEIGSGHYKSAESHLRQALTLADESLGEGSPETAAYATNLALGLLVQGQYDRAGTLLRRARFVIESRFGSNSVRLVNVFAELTSVEMRLGRFRIAEGYGEKALSILNSHVPADSREVVLTRINLGALYLREHKTAEAQKILPAAVEAERRFFKDGRILGDGIRDLAALRAQQHAWSDAESLYREAIGCYERNLGAGHPDLAPVLYEYAAVLKRRGASKTEIRNIEARARAIGNPTSHPEVS